MLKMHTTKTTVLFCIKTFFYITSIRRDLNIKMDGCFTTAIPDHDRMNSVTQFLASV